MGCLSGCRDDRRAVGLVVGMSGFIGCVHWFGRAAFHSFLSFLASFLPVQRVFQSAMFWSRLRQGLITLFLSLRYFVSAHIVFSGGFIYCFVRPRELRPLLRHAGKGKLRRRRIPAHCLVTGSFVLGRHRSVSKSAQLPIRETGLCILSFRMFNVWIPEEGRLW